MNGSLKYGIEYQEANAAAVAAFETWQNADCGDGKRPSLRIEDMGPMECGRHEYNPKGNANIFAFADEFWPYDKPYEDLALTLVTFDTRTGEIYDADIAINTANMRFVLADSESRGYDLTTVLTHEVGHFLGLGHSLETEATMRERYDSGVTDMRDLHADDIAGICALYPPDRDISSDACGPRKGFSDQCGGIPVDEEVASCSATRGRAGNGGVLVALAALAATYFRKPRRKTD